MASPIQIKSPGAILAVLTSINGLNYLDRYVLAGVLPLVIADLALSDAQAGSLHMAFIVVYALVAPLPGALGDRMRRLRIAAFGVALWSAATAASGLASTFAWLLVARTLVGVGEVSYAVVTPSLLADLYPAGRRGRVLAVFYAAISVGSALGYILGGAIGARHGWRAAFFVAGGPGLLLAFLLLLLPEPTRGTHDEHRSVSPTSPPPTRGTHDQHRVASPASPPSAPARASLAALIRRRSFVLNTVAQTIYTFSMGGLAFWMPTYFQRQRGLPLERAALIFGAMLAVAGLVATLVGGQIGDRLARRAPTAHFTFPGIALIASAPFTLVALLAPSPAIFWPAMFASLFTLFLGTGSLNAALTNVLPATLRARGFAVYSTAIHLFGDGPSPALIGAASDRMGLGIPVLAAGLLLPLAGVLLLLGRGALARDLEAA